MFVIVTGCWGRYKNNFSILAYLIDLDSIPYPRFGYTIYLIFISFLPLIVWIIIIFFGLQPIFCCSYYIWEQTYNIFLNKLALFFSSFHNKIKIITFFYTTMPKQTAHYRLPLSVIAPVRLQSTAWVPSPVLLHVVTSVSLSKKQRIFSGTLYMNYHLLRLCCTCLKIGL